MASSPARASRLVVAAAVVDSLSHPTRMLCAARSYPAEHAGQFELPGGKVEVSETPLEALARELVEEISLSVTLGAELTPSPELALPAPTCAPGDDGDPGSRTAWTALFPDDDAPAWPAMHGYRMRVWLAEPADGAQAVLGQDHETLRWVGLEALGELDWLPADLPVLAALRQAIAR